MIHIKLSLTVVLKKTLGFQIAQNNFLLIFYCKGNNAARNIVDTITVLQIHPEFTVLNWH